jgi:hypothetical protein
MTGEQRDGVLALLHEAIEHRTGTQPLSPVWPRIERGLRRQRLRRRARNAGKAGAGLLAVVALLAGVQNGVVPYPRWAAVPMPAAGSGSALADGVTRGSLAGDAAFLRGLRQRVAGELEEPAPGEALSVPPAASDVDVIYAADVGAYRIALIEGRWTHGAFTVPNQSWYVGPAGAAPGDLTSMRGGEPEDVVSFITYGVNPPGLSDITTKPSVVVLSAAPVEVRLRLPVEYGADGTARLRTITVEPDADGVYQAVVPRAGSYGVYVEGREVQTAATVQRTQPVAGATPPVRGGETPDQEALASGLSSALYAADLPDKETPCRLLRYGTAGGERYAVVAMTAPSGARVLAVVQHVGESETHVVSGTVLPSGRPLDSASIAWPLPDAARLGVLGPVGASTAVLLDGEQQEVGRTALADGFTVAERLSATSVRFLDADGRVVGEIPVSERVGRDETLSRVLSR